MITTPLRSHFNYKRNRRANCLLMTLVINLCMWIYIYIYIYIFYETIKGVLWKYREDRTSPDMFDWEWVLSIQSNSRVCGETRPASYTAAPPPTLPHSRPRPFRDFSSEWLGALSLTLHFPADAAPGLCATHTGLDGCDHLGIFSLRRFFFLEPTPVSFSFAKFSTLNILEP